MKLNLLAQKMIGKGRNSRPSGVKQQSMQYFIFFLCLIFQLFACKQVEVQKTVGPLVKRHVHLLGNTPITITTSTYGRLSNVVFIRLHDNEETAEKAALQILEERGGTVISIENKGNRIIGFLVREKNYVFDPNRMFTKKAIRESMQRLGSYHPAAAKEVREFSAAILKLIPKNAVTIALHNNADEGYSILSYNTDPILRQSAKAVHRNKTLDTDNFFITTNATLFHMLKKKNYNVVLQNNATAIDDGSLSVYMGKINSAYVNVEAQHGHLQEQASMLKGLLQQIDTLN